MSDELEGVLAMACGGTRLSKGFDSGFANDWVRDIVRRFGGRFDFGSLDQRIELGFEIVERLRGGRRNG